MNSDHAPSPFSGPRPLMQRVISIQILRALAAVGVVLAHAHGWLSENSNVPNSLPGMASLGGIGVELFFVVSGFVMVYASGHLFGRLDGPKDFALHRLIRIVPPYWAVTAIYVIAAIASPSLSKTYGLDFVISSFLFIPMKNAAGFAMPVVGHGWTLNYEMMFYAIFAIALVAPRRLAVGFVSAFLAGAVMLGMWSAPSATALVFWTNPIIFQFIYGMIIGLLYQEGVRLRKPLCVVLIAAGIVLIARDFVGQPHSSLRIGLHAALIVAGSTLGDFALKGPVWRMLAHIGDWSYAIYLLHSIPVRTSLLLSRMAPLDFASAPWLYVGLAVVGTIALGAAAYYLFERPVTRLLRNLLIPAPRAEPLMPRLSGMRNERE